MGKLHQTLGQVVLEAPAEPPENDVEVLEVWSANVPVSDW